MIPLETLRVPSRVLAFSLLGLSLTVAGCSSSDDDDSSGDIAGPDPVEDVPTADDPGPIEDTPTADDPGPIEDAPVIDSAVSAADGGVFTSDDGQVSVEIPPGALAQDATLQVTPSQSLANVTDTMSSAGDAFDVSFGAELLSPAILSVVVDTPPVHPQLAETAMIVDGEFVRSDANFFRPSDSTVVSLVDEGGTLQPILRVLQAESGDQVARGQEVFLNSTFGNEQFFGGVIGLQDVLNNVSPSQAVGVGAQVDIAQVPEDIVAVLTGDDFAAKQAALESSAVTRALLQADAVVGVRALFSNSPSTSNSDFATSVGLTCALCHNTVTPTEFEIAEGEFITLPIGPLALDGMPNTNIDVGTILSLTPFAQNAGEETIAFLEGFGVGAFDARALPDNPLEDGVLNPTSIPPLWNFFDLSEQGYTYNWDGFFGSSEDPDNAVASRDELVFDLVLHANGAFGTASASVPLEAAFPPSDDLVAALTAAEDEAPGNDIDTQSLLDLQAWERSLNSPAPAEFDEALAEEGFFLFNGFAQCSSCHMTAEFTGPFLSTEIVLVPPQGGLAGGIKTPGLRGVRLTAPYFHDSSAATLEEAVAIYSGRIVPELSESEISAIAEYMRSL